MTCGMDCNISILEAGVERLKNQDLSIYADITGYNSEIISGINEILTITS